MFARNRYFRIRLKSRSRIMRDFLRASDERTHESSRVNTSCACLSTRGRGWNANLVENSIVIIDSGGMFGRGQV